MGFAATRSLGEGAPLLAVIFLVVALAGAHRLFPGAIELLVGTAGLMFTVVVASDARRCGATLGEGGRSAVVVFGGLMLLSSLVRLLGSGSIREMARHLLVGTAALEVGLFMVSPAAEVATAQGRFTLPAVLIASGLVATVIGLRARRGFTWLGLALVGALVVAALTDSPCSYAPALSLMGSLVFAAVASFLAGDDRSLTTEEPWPDSRAPYTV